MIRKPYGVTCGRAIHRHPAFLSDWRKGKNFTHLQDAYRYARSCIRSGSAWANVYSGQELIHELRDRKVIHRRTR